ncbi:cytochrome-c peroxidase [Psychrobium sp. MM17-31]|uniref:cytochrome-c peroxidase n=1 Tax=Psychrobium sp. MM17-31 TaxID=2917758 RepID=UPI001EF66E1B|nr:cytochrome-c peroxidase [Psychrobium sp. MM17-31]
MFRVLSTFALLVLTLVCSSVMHAQELFLLQQLKDSYSQPQSQWPAIETADGRQVQQLAPLSLVKPKPLPSQVILGRMLFHDTSLSRDKTVSCSSCHESRLLFGDMRSQPIGIDMQRGRRNSPNIFGIDHWQSFFWDGRAETAEQQALMPIEDPKEMDFSVEGALLRINSETKYRPLIKKAFGTTTLNRQQLAKAIVAFERTIMPKDTLFSRFIAMVQHNPKAAITMLSESQLKGLHLYRTKARCMTCHNGPLLSDNRFHITGLHAFGRRLEDLGRYEHTQDPSDVGAFRTPSLVMVSHTEPWMHHGLFVSLPGIINFYNRGGAQPKPRKDRKPDPLFPTTTSLLKPLKLSKQEREDLLAFLKIL